MTLRSYVDTLNLLEAELAAIDARRPLIVASITAMRPLVDLNALTGPVEGHGAASAAAAQSTPASSSSPASEATGKKPRKPRDVHGASPAMAALDDQIITAVRTHQPINPGKVAALVNGKTAIVRGRVQLLVRSGRLVAEGATLKRVLRLPAAGTKPAAAPVAPPAASGVEAPEATAERDAAILTLVKRGPKTFDELLRGLTTKPADVSADGFRVLVKRSLRRLIMRGQLVDVGDKFKVAA